MITLTSLQKNEKPEKAPKKKTCKKCKEEKEINKFRKDSDMKDGRGNVCLACEKERSKELKKQREVVGEEFFNPKTPAF